ncbi:MAG: UDP-2,3-diacylglucosamine diphosphatase LpxG [Parachlamydiaceae bacterium]|nr:UDP-2,3-diacylglucosamine diphosphatase LpxG [Parachlamydiaceae bacterium]
MASNQRLTYFNKHLTDSLWDLWCIASGIGIWPRFIEPKLLKVSKKTITIEQLPKSLEGLRLLQFSDLHFKKNTSNRFLKKIQRKVAELSPDIIVFTGDFICHSNLHDPNALKDFLNVFKAPYGCYAVLGNHDYSEPVSLNDQGEYDVVSNSSSLISQGFSRLFKKVHLAKRSTPRASAIATHPKLIELLAKTPFTLLNNANICIPIGNSALNICGLGEYILGKTDPATAFKDYDNRYPGIILLHNPDGLRLLEKFPGEIVLSGHTHGGQVNLPWMWQKFTLLENPQFKSGLMQSHGKWIYINRGVGANMPFRWFAPPELLLMTLEASK